MTESADYECGRCGYRHEKRAYGPGFAKVCPDCRSTDVHLTAEAVARIAARSFRSQSARDAQRSLASGASYEESYLDYLDRAAEEHHAYFMARGDTEQAEAMFTRTLSEALAGNDGD